jgi:hypothetical protein
MEQKKTIPNKDVDFNVVQEVIFTKSGNNLSTWGLDVNWFNNTLKPKRDRWVVAWGQYVDPATRTPLIIFEKTEARKDYEPALRILVRNLEINTLVTDDDRKAMGIVIPSKNRKPLPVPDKYPGYRIDSSMIRCLGVDFFDDNSGGKPRGAHGVEIRWAILDAPPKSVDELTHSEFDTRSPFKLTFDESQRGKTVYFCLRWESNTGEKGPWSEIISAIVP